MLNRALWLPFLGLLAACPKEDAPKPSSAAPTTAKRPLTVAEPKPVDCKMAPMWVGLDGCQTTDGHVYATGRYTLKTSQRLARAVVAARARANVAGLARLPVKDKRMTVKDGEVLFIHQCDETWVALARLNATAPATVPACPDEFMAQPAKPSAGCRAWTARVGWKDGDTYYGVADVPLAKNMALAQKAAQARALTSARAVFGSIVGADGKSATIDNSSRGFRTLKVETATCAAGVFVKVAAQPSPEAPAPK